MNLTTHMMLICIAATGAHAGQAAEVALPPRQVPAKSIPVPMDVSPEMQKLIAAPLNPLGKTVWKNGAEALAAADERAAQAVATIPAMRQRLHVKVEPGKMNGVKTLV